MNFPILSSLILLPSVGALFILITGSSGNTREGQLVTFSGGARG